MNGPAPLPSLADVGAVIQTRTRDTNGATLGTFTVDTMPTDAQVNELIPSCADDVATVIGEDIPPAFFSQATKVIAIGTAMMIELSYFGDQVASGRSSYDQLQALYNTRLGRLKVSIDSSGQEGPTDADLRPQGGFDQPGGFRGACGPGFDREVPFGWWPSWVEELPAADIPW